jgi:tRNA pseudouridine55 synthase
MTSLGVDGFLNVIKPPGITSFDVIRLLRKRWPKLKMGHSGTLDMPACGVVVIALGGATKFLSYLPSNKEYVFEVIFGLETDTYDVWGNVIKETPMNVEESHLKQSLPNLVGRIKQGVPPFSSKREKGKRFYEMAQENPASVPQREAEVEIYNLELLNFTHGAYPKARLWMSCSAGTYVRSLARELGKLLGGTACAGFIVRVRSGPFSLESAQTINEINEGKEKLIPVEVALSEYPVIIIGDRYLSSFFNGHPFPSSSVSEVGSLLRLKDRRGNFLGLARVCGKALLKAEKICK